MKTVFIVLLVIILVLIGYLAFKPRAIAPTTDSTGVIPSGQTQVNTNPTGPDYQPQPHPTGQTQVNTNPTGADYMPQPHPTGQTQTIQNAGAPDYQPGK